MASRIGEILQEEDGGEAPEEADTAVFYSISNCQPGLRGISFGNFLVKQVVLELSGELPKLKSYVTLSPVPGFRKWLEEARAEGKNGPLDDGRITRREHCWPTRTRPQNDRSATSEPSPIARTSTAATTRTTTTTPKSWPCCC